MLIPETQTPSQSKHNPLLIFDNSGPAVPQDFNTESLEYFYSTLKDNLGNSAGHVIDLVRSSAKRYSGGSTPVVTELASLISSFFSKTVALDKLTLSRLKQEASFKLSYGDVLRTREDAVGLIGHSRVFPFLRALTMYIDSIRTYRIVYRPAIERLARIMNCRPCLADWYIRPNFWTCDNNFNCPWCYERKTIALAATADTMFKRRHPSAVSFYFVIPGEYGSTDTSKLESKWNTFIEVLHNNIRLMSNACLVCTMPDLNPHANMKDAIAVDPITLPSSLVNEWMGMKVTLIGDLSRSIGELPSKVIHSFYKKLYPALYNPKAVDEELKRRKIWFAANDELAGKLLHQEDDNTFKTVWKNNCENFIYLPNRTHTLGNARKSVLLGSLNRFKLSYLQKS